MEGRRKHAGDGGRSRPSIRPAGDRKRHFILPRTDDAPANAPLPPGSDYEGPAFEFEEVVPGIYHARGTGSLSVGSHGAVIVNEDDVLLVESHISPAAAQAVVDEIEALTDKPVRYVVNTHFHFDHAHGN